MSIPNTQWKYLLVGEQGEVRGTNEESVAVEASYSDVVIDMNTCQELSNIKDAEGKCERRNIEEQTWYQL